MSLGTDFRWSIDPVSFAKEALGFNPDPWQAEALDWRTRQAVWLCSRQAGKSTTAAILGLHTALYKPKALVLLVSPSLRQSKELYRKVVDFIGALDNPPKLIEDTKTACEFASGSRVVCLPGTEATVRGFSAADLIIEDEASRVADAFNNAIRPMLAVSQGRLVLLSTPFGKRGHFHSVWSGGSPSWHRIKVIAPECPRITKEFLASELDEIGRWWYDQEYLCIFKELVDAFFTSAEIEATFTDEVKPAYSDEFLASLDEIV